MESMQVYKTVINFSEDFSGVCYNISFFFALSYFGFSSALLLSTCQLLIFWKSQRIS